MIKIYGMPSCPDCSFVERQAEGREGYEVIDIGSHVRLLKEFLRLRDSSPVFDDARRHGRAGIPCFVLDDGRVTLVPEEAGLKSREAGGDGTSGGFEDYSSLGSAAGSGFGYGSAGLQASGAPDLQSENAAGSVAEGSACSLDGKGC